MKTTWQHSPGSMQHWLYKGSGISSAGLILGMIYEVSPSAFTVYRELTEAPWQYSNREFLAQMPTLDEAKDLLLTLAHSHTGETT